MGAISMEYGAVAILDALGASSYGEREIAQFLNSRQRVLTELNTWVEEPHGSVKIDPSQLVTFTFNDTIIIVLRCGTEPPTLNQATGFTATLRKFLVDSMTHGLLFRGAASFGSFYVDEATNTVMGNAVTDAAQWYERTEWMGIHFTPRTYLELTRMFELSGTRKEWAFCQYDVPLRGGDRLQTFAVNWPKIFLVPSLRPWSDADPARAKLLSLLSRHQVPLGTEQKYFNTISFFDESIKREPSTAS
jgi:hypothetical protein